MTYAPLLEWTLAAVWAGYQPDRFFELDTDWQNLVVAAYRTNNQIEAVIASEQAKQQAAAARKGKRGKHGG